MNAKPDLSTAIRHVVNACGADTVTITLPACDALAVARHLDLAVGLGRAPITGSGVRGQIVGDADSTRREHRP